MRKLIKEMSFDLLALAACMFIIVHGFFAFKAGIKKENRRYFFTVGMVKGHPYLANLLLGALNIFLGICGLILYVPTFFK